MNGFAGRFCGSVTGTVMSTLVTLSLSREDAEWRPTMSENVSILQQLQADGIDPDEFVEAHKTLQTCKCKWCVLWRKTALQEQLAQEMRRPPPPPHWQQGKR